QRRDDTLTIATVRLPAHSSDQEVRLVLVGSRARGNRIKSWRQRPEQALQLLAVEALGIAREKIDQLAVRSKSLKGRGVGGKRCNIAATGQLCVFLDKGTRQRRDVGGVGEMLHEGVIWRGSDRIDETCDVIRVIVGDYSGLSPRSGRVTGRR